ncbi:MAG TPA: TIGR00730 family Rossman fold protein [Polyangiaceae bacterium]|jgi:uncharacterized protein (TIGR00730 family)|nr:TIGR00730 family Rossman fold protein [Polyangiaceae bacterium]
MLKSICVFAGSSLGAAPEFAGAARALGREIARRGSRLVYGGARTGLMGVVAEAALAANGQVVGVMPALLVDREVAHRGLSELIVVGSMHERKETMARLSDGFAALPGGFGTLDEFFEALTWAQLGLHDKPCGLLDIGGYYQSLLAFMDRALAEGFVKEPYRSRVLVATDPAALLDQFESGAGRGEATTPLRTSRS